MEFPLTPANLTLSKERTYFTILVVFSGVVWLALIITIAPIIGLVIGGGLMWLVHGLFVARIKSEGVKLDANQLPELNRAFAQVCAQLNLLRIPELYLMQSGRCLECVCDASLRT
jgi:hypothetical protein